MKVENSPCTQTPSTEFAAKPGCNEYCVDKHLHKCLNTAHIFKLFSLEFSNIYKSREKSIRNLHVATIQLHYQHAAISFSTPHIFLLLSSFSCPTHGNFGVYTVTLLHVHTHIAPCICSEHSRWVGGHHEVHWERHAGLFASHTLGFSSSWTPRKSRLVPQVEKLFGCEPNISQCAVTPFPAQTNTKRRVPSSHLLGWTVHLVALWEASFAGIFLPHTKHAYEVNWEWQKQESPILRRLRSQGLPDNGAQTPNSDPKENKRCHGFCVHFQTKKYTGENKSRFHR